MCWGAIDWSAFTWEAFATLATGLAAVAAAWSLGRRQILIQKQQVDLQAESLRSDLFDRRYEVYEATESLIVSIVISDNHADNGVVGNFASAVRKSRLLFSQNVYNGLKEIFRRTNNFVQAKKLADRSYQKTGRYDDSKIQSQENECKWLEDQLRSLPDLFGEMTLGSLDGLSARGSGDTAQIPPRNGEGGPRSGGGAG